MVAIIRSLAGASRMGAARMSIRAPPAQLPRTFRTCAPQMAGKPTGSEESVHAEKHDADPKTLQKETAKSAQHNHETSHTATPNDAPTHSEDSVHADKHHHDPLPDHKKASNQ